VRRLTIQAATPSSAHDLNSALSVFYPQVVTDDEGKCFVSVELGSDREVVEVLAAIQRFVDAKAVDAVKKSVVVALDERRYTFHPE
jgi:hypothetical protein